MGRLVKVYRATLEVRANCGLEVVEIGIEHSSQIYNSKFGTGC